LHQRELNYNRLVRRNLKLTAKCSSKHKKTEKIRHRGRETEREREREESFAVLAPGQDSTPAMTMRQQGSRILLSPGHDTGSNPFAGLIVRVFPSQRSYEPRQKISKTIRNLEDSK